MSFSLLLKKAPICAFVHLQTLLRDDVMGRDVFFILYLEANVGDSLQILVSNMSLSHRQKVTEFDVPQSLLFNEISLFSFLCII